MHLKVLLPVLLFAGCAGVNNYSLIGEYASYSPLLTTKSFITGNKLLLNGDSSFVYSQCGQVVTGKWAYTGDSIFLYCGTFRYRDDSLQRVKQTNCGDNERYESLLIMHNGDLFSEIKLENNKAINRLRKVRTSIE